MRVSFDRQSTQASLRCAKVESRARVGDAKCALETKEGRAAEILFDLVSRAEETAIASGRENPLASQTLF